MLSALVERFKRALGSMASDSEGGDEDDGPDLFECEHCGAVFISEPSECSNCEDDDFSNVGTF